jgi:hypothetical protein
MAGGTAGACVRIAFSVPGVVGSAANARPARKSELIKAKALKREGFFIRMFIASFLFQRALFPLVYGHTVVQSAEGGFDLSHYLNVLSFD